MYVQWRSIPAVIICLQVREQINSMGYYNVSANRLRLSMVLRRGSVFWHHMEMLLLWVVIFQCLCPLFCHFTGTDHPIAHLYDVSTFQCYLSSSLQDNHVGGAINQVAHLTQFLRLILFVSLFSCLIVFSIYHLMAQSFEWLRWWAALEWCQNLVSRTFAQILFSKTCVWGL